MARVRFYLLYELYLVLLVDAICNQANEIIVGANKFRIYKVELLPHYLIILAKASLAAFTIFLRSKVMV